MTVYRRKTKDTLKRSREQYATFDSPIAANEKNDCVVRALAVATGWTYDEAHRTLARVGRKPGEGTHMSLVDKALHIFRVPFGRIKLPVKTATRRDIYGWPNTVYLRPTLKQVLAAHPQGTFIASTNEHAFAIIDGVVHDWSRYSSGSRSRITTLIKLEA